MPNSLELPIMPGSRFLAASWKRAGAGDRLLSRLQGWQIVQGDGWLLASEKADCFGRHQGAAVATSIHRLFDRRAARNLGAADLAAQLAQKPDFLPSELASLAAPFRLAWVSDAGATPTIATDGSGLGQVFHATGGDVAVASSSAALIASLIGAGPDVAALASFAQFGSFPFEETPFAGVRKLSAGSLVRLNNGQCLVESWLPSEQPGGSISEALRQCVSMMVRADAAATMELSGGLDSRLVLAAMAPEDRRGRLSLTIGSADYPSADVTLARRIAAAEGLDHRVVDVGGMNLDRADMPALLDHVIDGYDRMANPLDKLPLVFANNGYNETARFGGQNGEIMRGFYYPLQPLEAQPSRALANRLISTRLIGNDRVDPSIFSHAAGEPLKAAREKMADHLMQGSGTWGDVLDRFYLDYRMQSWAGNGISNRFVGRTIFWPFFDRGVLRAAYGLKPADKQHSMAAYRLLLDLDPALARLPLDTGVVPAFAVRGGLGARIAQARMTAMKVKKKLAQRLGRNVHQVIGADVAAGHWHRQEGHKRLDFDALSRLGLFDSAFLDSVAAGKARPDRPTLGFVLLCNAVVKP